MVLGQMAEGDRGMFWGSRWHALETDYMQYVSREGTQDFRQLGRRGDICGKRGFTLRDSGLWDILSLTLEQWDVPSTVGWTQLHPSSNSGSTDFCERSWANLFF